MWKYITKLRMEVHMQKKWIKCPIHLHPTALRSKTKTSKQLTAGDVIRLQRGVDEPKPQPKPSMQDYGRSSGPVTSGSSASRERMGTITSTTIVPCSNDVRSRPSERAFIKYDSILGRRFSHLIQEAFPTTGE